MLVTHGTSYRVRIRWRNLLNLSVCFETKDEATEVELALQKLKRAHNHAILAAIHADPASLLLAVDLLAKTKIETRKLTVADLRGHAAPDASTWTLAEAYSRFDAYLTRHGINRRGVPYTDSTAAGYRSAWKQFLRSDAAIKVTYVSELTQWTLKAYRSELQERTAPIAKNGRTAGPAAINRQIMAIRALYTFVREDEHGSKLGLPPLQLRPLTEQRHARRAILPAEMKAIFHELKIQATRGIAAPFVDMFTFLLETGLREGEALALTHGQCTTAAALDLRGTEEDPLKTRKSERLVPVTPKAARILKRYMPKKRAKDCFVFPKEMRSAGALRQAWGRACDKARDALGGTLQARIHDLRHTYAVNLLLAGHDITTVRDRLGHESIETTQGYLESADEFRLRLGARARTRKRGRRNTNRKPGKPASRGARRAGAR